MKKHLIQYLKLLSHLSDDQFEEIKDIINSYTKRGEKPNTEDMFDIALNLLSKNFEKDINQKLS